MNATRLVLHQDAPEYPSVAKVNYVQGRVRMEVEVSREGRVVRAHVTRGNPILAASALAAVRRWAYRPLVTPAGPRPFLVDVEVNFVLHFKKVNRTPRDPESDLNRQVKPPEVVARPTGQDPDARALLHLLLNEEGQIIDSEVLKGTTAPLEAIRRSLRHWSFRPARWGAIPIPWYIDVDVPVNDLATRQSGGDWGGR
jgi:TonB family protein